MGLVVRWESRLGPAGRVLEPAWRSSEEFESRNSNEQLTSNDERLKMFLGGDWPTIKILEERGKYLAILKQKLIEQK